MYNVGIIGVGVVGARLLASFAEHPETRLKAVCDVSAERVQEVMAQHEGISGYTDYRQMLRDEELDLVYIGVPPKWHHEIALDVLAAGKHLLCEKPLANTLEEAEEMYEMAKKSGKVHAMNFPTYYRPVGKELVRRLNAGEIGEVERVEIVTHFPVWPRPWQQTPWIAGREQGGFLREVVPHFLHLTLKLFGDVEVTGSTVEYPEDETLCETGVVGWMELVNYASVVLDGKSGTEGDEVISYTIYGTKGTLSLRNWSELWAGGVAERLQPVELPEESPTERSRSLIDQVLLGMRGEEADLADFKIGLDVQRLLEALRG